MNRLLGTLEDLGYVARSDSPEEGRARIVQFTKRGHAAYAKILDILRDIEREWSAELGSIVGTSMSLRTCCCASGRAG